MSRLRGYAALLHEGHNSERGKAMNVDLGNLRGYHEKDSEHASVAQGKAPWNWRTAERALQTKHCKLFSGNQDCGLGKYHQIAVDSFEGAQLAEKIDEMADTAIPDAHDVDHVQGEARGCEEGL